MLLTDTEHEENGLPTRLRGLSIVVKFETFRIKFEKVQKQF